MSLDFSVCNEKFGGVVYEVAVLLLSLIQTLECFKTAFSILVKITVNAPVWQDCCTVILQVILLVACRLRLFGFTFVTFLSSSEFNSCELSSLDFIILTKVCLFFHSFDLSIETSLFWLLNLLLVPNFQQQKPRFYLILNQIRIVRILMIQFKVLERIFVGYL